MRVTKSSNGLKVHAVAGTYVVLFGFNLEKAKCEGLLGFSVHREDHTEGEAAYLEGLKRFEETDPGLPAGSGYKTNAHPIQSFQWADYSAKPGHSYTYTVEALKGEPADLRAYARVVVDIETESPEGGRHDIYFNRGVAGSQAYVRRFGDKAPENVPNRAAFVWLSRGLNEALEAFITDCEPGRDALRIAAYEFNYEEFLRIIKATAKRGVDLKAVYDARKDVPRKQNDEKVAALGLKSKTIRRTASKSAISHNKFIVKLRDGKPVSVWTGGTNFSEGGIYGHSNVAHVVEDAAVARNFLKYWELLADDLESKDVRPLVEALSPLPSGEIPTGTTVLFSPRQSLDALEWYADVAMSAQEGLFMTFAFGMNDVFKNVYKSSSAPMRMALMEKKTRSFKEPADKEAEEARIDALRRKKENVFAIGAFVRTNRLDGWLKERLTGLNTHVRYIHNKFMLVDPLSDDPIVIAGSANFSAASTTENDENMLVVRGDKRVADIYLGEFMRLYSHHAFRESLQWRDRASPVKYLETGDWWRDYFGATARSTRRRFFARVST